MSKQDKILKNYMTPRQWFNMDMEKGEIQIYDMIGANFWGNGLSSKGFINQCKELEKKFSEINIRVNSPGGDIAEALHIYNYMNQSPTKFYGYVEGIAASCASWMILPCDKIYMPPTSEMLIHDPWGMCVGGSEDMRKSADYLDQRKEMISGMYVTKTGQDKKKIEKMMSDETYMDGATCVELGFADELQEEYKAAACLFELDEEIFPNLPEGFKKLQNALKKRAQEQSLRDEGLSRAEAARRASSTVLNIEETKTQANELIKKEFSKWLIQ